MRKGFLDSGLGFWPMNTWSLLQVGQRFWKPIHEAHLLPTQTNPFQKIFSLKIGVLWQTCREFEVGQTEKRKRKEKKKKKLYPSIFPNYLRSPDFDFSTIIGDFSIETVRHKILYQNGKFFPYIKSLRDNSNPKIESGFCLLRIFA